VPTYLLEEFVGACARGEVTVLGPALSTAPSDFQLATVTDVLEFIGYGGMENPEYLNSKLWMKNPNPPNLIFVDAYSFFSGPDYGYVAFMRGATGRWLLKSLKKNGEPPPNKFPPFLEQCKKAGLTK